MAQEYPFEYLHQPRVAKPRDQIFADLDRFSWEVAPGERPIYLATFVLLPPLRFEGRSVKGILLSHDADYLLSRFPGIPEQFHTIANSRFCSYPHSLKANALCTLYPCPEREAWFRAEHPERAGQILIPFQAPDWTHEASMAPVPGQERDIDVLCVARLIANKNLPFLAKVLKIYRQKHGAIRMTLPNGYDTPWNQMTGHEGELLQQMEAVLGRIGDYIDLIEPIPFREMARYYSRAKVVVLGSLLEGKNRALHEAMCCDTPVVCCREFNHYLRGKTPVFPGGAGLDAPFEPEGFADVLHKALTHHRDFRPRQAYLSGFSGRRWTFNTCLDTIPYYSRTIPGYRPGEAFHHDWLKRAFLANYGAEPRQFFYGAAWRHLRYADGEPAHEVLFEGFTQRGGDFQIAKDP